jgi:DNA-binding MarR family transcriptional regulator
VGNKTGATNSAVLTDSIMRLMYDVRNIMKLEMVGKTRLDILTYWQLHALSFIAEEGPMSMRDLAMRMSITAASATSLVDRLVRHGLASRVSSKGDRRSVHVAVTDTGRKCLHKHVSDMQKRIAGVVGKLSVNNQKNLISVLEELQRTYSK